MPKFKQLASIVLILLAIILAYQALEPIMETSTQGPGFSEFDDRRMQAEMEEFQQRFLRLLADRPKESAILRSENNGVDWQEVRVMQQGINIVSELRISRIFLDDQGQLFIGTFGEGILRCSGNQTSWEVEDWYFKDADLFVLDFAKDPGGNVHCVGNFSGILVLNTATNEWRRIDPETEHSFKAIDYNPDGFAVAVMESSQTSGFGSGSNNAQGSLQL
jgi:hypothetical protein